jgi:NTE family protein
LGLWRRKLRLNLALQGGGAHGAFTWGVLDRLLEEPTLEIAAVSGSSAGAVNAVALAAGFVAGGADGARKRLAAVWDAIEKAQLPDFMRPMARLSMAHITSVLSPYEFNPLNFDPLRNLLANQIDFDRLRRQYPFELMLAATEVRTGAARLFRARELGVESVLASACLPSLHKAVEIGGTHYWDGGYSSNPPLVELAAEEHARDTLIVQLLPLARDEVPTRAREIGAQVHRMAFSQPLAREAALIGEMQRLGALARRLAPARSRRIARHRFHLIDASPITSRLPDESALDPDGQLLSFLHEAGRREAAAWLARDRRHVGRRSSIDPAQMFLRGQDSSGASSLDSPPA